jgi:hypothetical protein
MVGQVAVIDRFVEPKASSGQVEVAAPEQMPQRPEIVAAVKAGFRDTDRWVGRSIPSG